MVRKLLVFYLMPDIYREYNNESQTVGFFARAFPAFHQTTIDIKQVNRLSHAVIYNFVNRSRADVRCWDRGHNYCSHFRGTGHSPQMA